jgi:hypothetical protein
MIVDEFHYRKSTLGPIVFGTATRYKSARVYTVDMWYSYVVLPHEVPHA